jgi:hypothetical protein
MQMQWINSGRGDMAKKPDGVVRPKKIEVLAKDGPKILTLDIETWPYVLKTWEMGKTYNQHQRIVKDRALACAAAKWAHEKDVMFFSTQGKRDLRDDYQVVKKLVAQVNKADVLITQNGKRFDIPIITGRIGKHELDPIPKIKHFDNCQLAKRLGLPSTSNDYLTAMFAPQYRKLKHKKFPGNELWDECENGNPEAWEEMEKYNKRDVLGTEAVFFAIARLFGINLSVYYDKLKVVCVCGSEEWKVDGHSYESTGKYRRYRCSNCDSCHVDKSENLLSKEKRLSLKGGVK